MAQRRSLDYPGNQIDESNAQAQAAEGYASCLWSVKDLCRVLGGYDGVAESLSRACALVLPNGMILMGWEIGVGAAVVLLILKKSPRYPAALVLLALGIALGLLVGSEVDRRILRGVELAQRQKLHMRDAAYAVAIGRVA